MVLTKKFLSHILIILLMACSNRQESAVEGDKISISFSSFKINESNYFPEKYIKEFIYIPIKRDFGQDYFGFIDKIKFKNGNIFIMDRSKKILSVFNENGRFLQHVGVDGKRPSDYKIISDFDVDENGFVYLLDGYMDKDRLLIYNSNFELERIEELSFEADVIKVGNEKSLFFGLSSWNQGDFMGKKILITNDEIKNAIPFLDYDEELIETIKIDYQFGSWKNRTYYNKPIDNSVHVFDEEGNFKEVLDFDFGILNVPNGLKNNLEENIEALKNFRYLKNFVVGFDKGYLGSLYDQGDYRIFLIDTQENRIFMGQRLDYYGFSGQFVGFDDGYVLSYLNPEFVGDYTLNDLPEAVVKHLQEDEFVIRLLKL